jgi:DNA-binding transcriptional ArsR family regulator
MPIQKDLKEAVAALDHPIRWHIVELIEDEGELSYTELLSRLRIRKGSLTHHLNRLMEGGLMDNFSKNELGDSYHSYYSLSRFGQDFVNSLEYSTAIESPAVSYGREPTYKTRASSYILDIKEIKPMTILRGGYLRSFHLYDVSKRNLQYSARVREYEQRIRADRIITLGA